MPLGQWLCYILRVSCVSKQLFCNILKQCAICIILMCHSNAADEGKASKRDKGLEQNAGTILALEVSVWDEHCHGTGGFGLDHLY